jgi:hypothetical protein
MRLKKKTRGPLLQQVWHNKDLSLLKGPEGIVYAFTVLRPTQEFFTCYGDVTIGEGPQVLGFGTINPPFFPQTSSKLY